MLLLRTLVRGGVAMVLFALAALLFVVASPNLVAQTLMVMPDGLPVLKQPNTNHSANFGLAGLVSGQGYFREIFCTGQVTNCTSTTPQNFTAPLAGITVTYTTTSTGTGTIKLKVYKGGGTPKDTGWFNLTVDGVAPTIQLVTPGGSVGVEYPTIQLAWCDNSSLNESTRWIKVNGVLKTSSFDYVMGGSGCVKKYTSTTSSVSLTMGSNTIEAYICDNVAPANCTQTSFSITRLPRGVAVRAELPERQHFAGTSGSQRFFIKNLQLVPASFTLEYDCTSMPAGCGLTPATLSNVPPGESRVATLTYNLGAPGTEGTPIVKAVDNIFRDSASVAVKSIGAPAPVVSVVDANPGIAVQRDLCLTIAAGAGAAFECGDLRIVHALPTIRTLNKARTPTLLYNSAHAEPYPILAANVTLASGQPSWPDSVEALLTLLGSTDTIRGRWDADDWTGGATRRIALGYSPAAGGVYDHTLEVATLDPVAGRQATSVTGKLIVVDRRSSGLGAGWWPAGLEQMTVLADGNRLWVGGDGSARVYKATVDPNAWVAPPMSRPDTLKKVAGGQYYRTVFPGATKVWFSAQGLHDSTVNRLGQRTSFAYHPNAYLMSITLPSQGGGQAYTFAYDSTPPRRVVTVTAPGSRLTTLWLTSQRVDSIRGPDNKVVRFTYEDASSRRIATRTDRLGTVTSYNYDAAKKLSRAHVNLQPDSIRVGFAAVETRGFFMASPKTAVDTANAYTAFYGARHFATDPSDRLPQETRFYVDRSGAVQRVRDALNQWTTVRREDGQWSALPTEIVDVSSFVARAGYDIRGNTTRSVAVNALGNGQDAVTRYHWDPKWDFIDTLVTPMGVNTTIGYDAATGNRQWQQLGSGANRRVNFSYNAQQLLASTILPQTPGDSIVYDAQGNLAAMRTPKGFWTSYYKDAFGRDTLVVTPIDSADKSRGGPEDITIRQRQRVVYTVMGQDSIVESKGPNDTERVQVDKRYDEEGHLVSLARQSHPDYGNIGVITTRWRYDRAGRRVAEVAPDTTWATDSDNPVDSTRYDPAGNVVKVVSRRTNPTGGARLAITMSYDTLNRLRTRALDGVTYKSRFTGFDSISQPWPVDSYPAYAIPSETHTFTYDAMGHLLTADNADAKVRRSYYPGGLMKTDSLRIQTVDRNDWEKHKYGIRYTYDLDGRRDSLYIPHQLRAGNDSAISYAYDPQLGFLLTLKDLQRNPYTFAYNLQGQLSSITYPGKYSRAISYDVDGRPTADTIRNDSTAAYPRIPQALVRAARSFYDARSKLLQSGDSAGRFRDTLKASYTGLGNLAASLWIQHGCVNCDLAQGTRHATLENVSQQDGLANRRLRTVVDAAVWGTFPNGGWSGNPDVTDTSTYEPYTGRLTSMAVSYPAEMPRNYYSYDQAGNNDFSWALSQAKPSSERASFFAADGSLRMVDSRAAIHDHAQYSEGQQYAVEDYRYDALGRRVWVRAQRRCMAPTTQFEATECRTSLIRRTIWDGTNELAEIQMPWAIQGTFAQHSITEYTDLLENDTLSVSVSQMLAPGPGGMGDPNPYFGHVVYAGLLGADQPLAVTRVNYAFKQDWHYPSNTYNATVKAPFTIVPFWDPRGDARGGVVSSGAMTLCDPPTGGPSPPDGYLKCVGIQWPWDLSSADRQGSLRRGSWHGTVLESKRDKSGLGFKRNRYFDPATGRFTQEDPIGFAGGLNLYGFAAGDPVNHADPFGLSADTLRHGRCKVAGLLKAYVEALGSNPGQFAAGFRGANYPPQFDYKYQEPALFEVGGRWLRNDEFGNFAAGYAGMYVYGTPGFLGMRAGGVVIAADRDNSGKRVSGEHWSDRDSAPMINAGAGRAWLDHPSLPAAGMHGSGVKPYVGPSLLSTAGCDSKTDQPK